MGLLTALPFILFFPVLISLWFPVVPANIKPDIKQTQFLSPRDLMLCGKSCWVCVLMLPFPRRAASSIHVCLYVVQHVSQRVLDDSSPAHVTHLTGKTHTHTQIKKISHKTFVNQNLLCINSLAGTSGLWGDV